MERSSDGVESELLAQNALDPAAASHCFHSLFIIRLMKTFLATLVGLLAAASTPGGSAYVTSPGAVPHQRQKQWLQKLTTEFCRVKPGQLSTHQLSQAGDLMYAWSHTRGGKENAIAVENLMKRLVEEQQAGNPNAITTVQDYNCVLEGWARSQLGSAAAERCDQILETMQERGPKPDMTSFKATLTAWKFSSESYAPIRAQRILEWMIRLYQEGENDSALPDADCFDMVLQTWSRSGLPSAPQKAEKLLGVMERLFESTGLDQLKPRTVSFNAVLAAWSKSNDSNAGNRASDILAFMELLESHGDSTVAPDSASYATVMGALAHSEDQATAARKADAFLQQVEERYKNNEAILPDTILFNTAMGCWAKSKVSGAYRRARSILDRQAFLFQDGAPCRPDVYGYTSVIASCAAEREEKEKAFNVALATFRELQECDDLTPNHVTYGAMLKACAKLLPNSSFRRKWVRRIFEECVQDGFVGDLVVSRLNDAASPDLLKELMPYKRRDIPEEWYRNVDEKDPLRKKKSNNKTFRRRAEV